MLEQIISGGQTGVDQVALEVAQSLGFKTGGMVPKGWRTDAGPAPWLGTQYGCVESEDRGYTVRTVANVRAADGTIWFGNPVSPGGRLTIKIAKIEQGRRHDYGLLINPSAETLRYILETENPKILNIAGNRLRTNPEATEMARKVLSEALRP